MMIVTTRTATLGTMVEAEAEGGAVADVDVEQCVAVALPALEVPHEVLEQQLLGIVGQDLPLPHHRRRQQSHHGLCPRLQSQLIVMLSVSGTSISHRSIV